MNDIAELKQYVLVHARAQGVPARVQRRVLDRIETDEGAGPGSWVGEWNAAAARAAQPLDVARCYNLARFPYVDGPARAEAQRRCVAAVERWAAGRPGLRRVRAELDGQQIRCWTAGLSAAEPRPLLLVMGGIVTIKEQWAPVLAGLGRLGMAGVVAELPGVGENPLPYRADSARMISAVLDALDGQADTSQTYAMALSFSGHLALRCALDDSRIRGIVTAGAPVRDFFTDQGRLAALPRVTTDTLAHLIRCDPAEVPRRIAGWELSREQLAGLRIPVHYLASERDEIIPPGDPALLEGALPDAHVVRNNDVHGSPRHTAETRLWSILSVLRMRGVRDLRTAALASMLRARRMTAGARA